VADSPNLDQTQPLRPQIPASFARFRLKAEIGRGGMGVVWRAEDTKLRRDVALKFLPDYVVRDREAMADLAAETRRCLELTHPHIVRVYDLVEEGARAAISMEFVDGGSLADRKLSQLDRCFSAATIAPWIAQLCAALDYAHTKVRTVHRDLKPLNLLVNPEGDLKVVDFGIARSLLNSGTRLSTEAKSSSVSLGYAGPQQVMGEPAAVTDDIYSLGATIYELLTGKPPFYEGDIITQLREVVPPSMAERRAALGVTTREPIPAAWEETVAACLAKKAADRPQTAAEIAARLGFPLGGNTRFLETATRPPPAAPPQAPRLTWIAAGIAAAALVLGALFWPKSQHPENAARAPVAAPGARIEKSAPSVPSPRPATPLPPAPEFIVTVSPPDAGAHVWLANATDRAVPDTGVLALTGLPDGEHPLTVQAPGYDTFSPATRVAVTGGKGAIEVKLVPVFGSIQIVARAGTLVTATDARGREKSLGTVPATGRLRVDNVLTVGTYLFEFEHPDCAPVQQTNVALTKGRVAHLAPLQTAQSAELRVFSVPDGAEVLVNGTKVGVTPATLPGQPSEKPLTVEVFLPGYRREKQPVTLKPREARTVNVGSLVPEGGAIELREGAAEFRGPRATVRVDGHELALKNGRIEGVEVGKHELEILHADFEPWKKTVTILDKQTTREVVVLQPKPAELLLEITGPATYTLLVNGQVAAVKNRRVTLPSNQPLALEISAKGFKTDRRTLTLPIRGKATVTCTLEKIALAETGQAWTVPNLGLTLLPVAPGSFAMGSETGDPTERPVTQVTITRPFWLGKTEVTQREWTALMNGNPSRSKGDDRPVENVSWNDAMEFCRLLTLRERAADRLPPGYVYTLPTEAQWEYTSRAGDKGETSADIADTAWHEQNSGDTTHPVATRRANAWGFHDMEGNVWEWCLDQYSAKLRGGRVNDPKGAAGADRVRRGGSYMVKPSFLRFAYRGKSEPEFRWYNIGFRVALAPGT
jgi:formylglycine-generating enzyme required for sulfatase activity/serine/threonine protein kinase